MGRNRSTSSSRDISTAPPPVWYRSSSATRNCPTPNWNSCSSRFKTPKTAGPDPIYQPSQSEKMNHNPIHQSSQSAKMNHNPIHQSSPSAKMNHNPIHLPPETAKAH